jgi:hypothetical protein
MKLKKLLILALSLISLSAMHEVVDETVLPNSFSKTAQLHLESCS